MRVRFHVDFELSPRVKRALKVAVPLAVVLAGSVVYASVPNTFKDGDILSAQTMNDNFTSLDTRLGKLEAFAAKATSDGGFAIGATYCGATGNTVGDLSGLPVGGSSYGKARTACQTTCSASGAHMCVGEELARSAALGITTIPQGWYSSGAASGSNFECAGASGGAWTTGSSSTQGSAWSGNQEPNYVACNSNTSVLCCD